MKPTTYRLHNCCATCAHVFKREDHDCEDEYYCTLDAPPRPPCGSVFMEESFHVLSGQKTFLEESSVYETLKTDWDNWKAGREVQAFGVCGNWNSFHVARSDPEILSGTPVFAGTRVPIAVLFENLAGGLTLDEILESWPSIKREQAIETLRQANRLLANEAEEAMAQEIIKGICNDDGAAAKAHLAAGNPIYYCDDRYPGEIVKEFPDGRRQIVVMRGQGKVEVVRDIAP